MAKETEAQIEARMEAARNKLAQDVQDKFNKDGDVDDRDRRLEAAGRLRRTEPVSTATAKKAPAVTKEQLEKSGLSLRDYMNKQKGLTRRGGAAPEAPQREKSAAEKRSDTRLRASKATADVAAAQLAKRYNSIPDEVYSPGSHAAAYAERGMKKGGSVRGAGIAQRGVRKCKMI